jgi:cytochrome c biogenesis protein CcdA
VVVLLGIAFLAGLITAISPCVLPVLPVLLAGGASGRRPYAIIAGLVGSFTVFTVDAYLTTSCATWRSPSCSCSLPPCCSPDLPACWSGPSSS